jgi:ferrous iron transport protein B
MIPNRRTVCLRVYNAGKAFIKNAGTLIFAMAIIVWAFAYFPHPKSIVHEHDQMRQVAQSQYTGEALTAKIAEIDRAEGGAYLRQSVLGRMGKWVEPFVKPLGWDWRIGMATIAAFPAREVVIATLGTIYNLGGDEDESSGSLHKTLQAATWPDGRKIFNIPVALSIMVFFALCSQCMAMLAAIKQELGEWKWPVFAFCYTTVLAYVGALVTYQFTMGLGWGAL